MGRSGLCEYPSHWHGNDAFCHSDGAIAFLVVGGGAGREVAAVQAAPAGANSAARKTRCTRKKKEERSGKRATQTLPATNDNAATVRAAGAGPGTSAGTRVPQQFQK